MRYLHLVVAAVFVLMAAIQLNDPDPAYWILAYSSVAVVAVQFAFGWQSLRFMYGVAGLLFAGIIIATPGFLDYLFSGQWEVLNEPMNDSLPYIESAREFIGLVLGEGALLYYLRQSVR